MTKRTSSPATKTAKAGKTAAMARKDEAAYSDFHHSVIELLETARHTAARSINALMTASYWGNRPTHRGV